MVAVLLNCLWKAEAQEINYLPQGFWGPGAKAAHGGLELASNCLSTLPTH